MRTARALETNTSPTPASRSRGTRTAPAAQVVRLTEQQNAVLHETAKREGKSIQSYLQAAVSRALEESNSEQVERNVRARRIAHAFNAMNDIPEERRRGGGMRLRDRLANLSALYEDTAREEPAPPAPPPAPQVVVNTGGSAVTEVDMIAAYVARGGPVAQRDDRMRLAAQILKTSAKGPDDEVARAKALDAAVATLETRTPEPPKRSALDVAMEFFR